MYNTRYSCQILKKIKFSPHMFERYSNINFRENPSSRNRVVPCRQNYGQTDMMKVTVALSFLEFCKVPKNPLVLCETRSYVGERSCLEGA